MKFTTKDREEERGEMFSGEGVFFVYKLEWKIEIVKSNVVYVNEHAAIQC